MKKWIGTLTGGGCQVLITRNNGYLILDGRYLTEAKEKEHDLTLVLHNPHITGKNYLSKVEELLKQNECQTLGVEASQTLVKEYQSLKEMNVEVHLLDQEIAYLRMIKDIEEIDAMKKAIAIT
ncbi:MAG: aminopeptidase P family N-terminal domain-containing protein, partial [Erysipelotrichaceae bacterium]|nr:aminopeptidase P family N-terminal domain-containing protein [Erysipelotrichaceae bacterium]